LVRAPFVIQLLFFKKTRRWYHVFYLFICYSWISIVIIEKKQIAFRFNSEKNILDDGIKNSLLQHVQPQIKASLSPNGVLPLRRNTIYVI
jgi:hypothetical protein